LLKQDEVTEKDVQEYKNEAEKTLQNIENEKNKLEQKLDSTLKVIEEQAKALKEEGKPVQDSIVSNANKLWDEAKESVTNIIGETDLTLEEAKRIGICEFAYNAKDVFGAWKYVDDNQVKFISDKDSKFYLLGKNTDGSWGWNVSDPGQTPVYSTPLKCQ
jgi:seryl-tRNA synthetase